MRYPAIRRILFMALVLPTAWVQARFDAIRTLTPEQGQEIRRPIEAQIFRSPLDELPSIERALLDIFRSSGTTLEGRRYACRMLRYCASDACVPVLAPRLTDAELSAYVRLVLQGLNTPMAEKALINALPNARSDIKTGIVGTLGQGHGSPEAVRAVAHCLRNSSANLQLAAMNALADMGGEEAARALVNARVQPRYSREWKQAQLRCAGTLDPETAGKAYRLFLAEEHEDGVRAAALVGLTARFPEESAATVFSFLSSGSIRLNKTAAGLLADLPTERLAGQLADMDQQHQMRVLRILAERRDTAAESAVLKLTEANDADMRKAAYGALGEVGGPSAVTALAAAAVQDADAFNALCALKADGTDDAVMAALTSADDETVQRILMECLALREVTAALPLLEEMAAGAWSRRSQAAVDGMASLVSEADFTAYAHLLTATDQPRKIEALEQSMAAAAQRLSDRNACAKPLIEALEQAGGETGYALIRSLGSIGGADAYAVLTQAVAAEDPQRSDAALRGLANWPTLDAAPVLLKLAQESDQEKYRVLALRGYIRLAGTVTEYQPAYEMCLQAAQATERPAELKAVISCIKRFKTPEVLDFLAEQLENKAVFSEAGWAVCEISSHWTLRKISIPVLERIAEKADDRQLSDQAEKLLREYNT